MDYLEIQTMSFPEQKAVFSELTQTFQQKLWHQLGTVLEKVIEDDFFQQDQRLIQMHDDFVSKVKDQLRPITYARFAVAVSQQYPDVQASLNFLESILGAVKDEQALVMVNMEICRRKTAKGDLDECKDIIEEQKSKIDQFTGIMDSLIHSHFHLASMEFYKANGPAASYYRSAMLYLTYTPLDAIKPDRQVALAYDVALSALIGHKIYNFGELLQHPILKTLASTEHQWLFELITTFNAGDLNKTKSLFDAKAKDQAVLVSNIEFLQQKIRIMALMELVFRKDAQSRVLSFKEISAHCDLPVNEVEWLLMKSFSLEVLKGQIDQVEQRVRIKWVQPRVLDLDQIASMKDRIASWSDQVKSSAAFVEENSPELLAH